MREVFAQTAPGTGGPQGPPQMFSTILPFVLIGAIFYFILIRPEQRKRKEHDALIAGLKKNDQVVMTSGIHGRVTAVGDKVLQVEIAPKVQVQVDASAVATVAQKSSGGEAREKEKT
jgi:preprotein translocase subunit YajC